MFIKNVIREVESSIVRADRNGLICGYTCARERNSIMYGSPPDERVRKRAKGHTCYLALN